MWALKTSETLRKKCDNLIVKSNIELFRIKISTVVIFRFWDPILHYQGLVGLFEELRLDRQYTF